MNSTTEQVVNYFNGESNYFPYNELMSNLRIHFLKNSRLTDLDDTFHDVLIRFIENYDKFDINKGEAITYIQIIARNLIINNKLKNKLEFTDEPQHFNH